MIFVRKSDSSQIQEVSMDSAGCGLMGMMGNKGGTSIRFKYYNSTFCFVNSHLAAYTNQVQRRNQDFSEICKRISFLSDSDDGIDYYSIFDCEYLKFVMKVFCFGWGI